MKKITMPALPSSNAIILAAGAGAVLLGYLLVRKITGGNGSMAANIATNVTQAASDVVGAVGQEAASWVGVPKTDKTECEQAMEEGRTWDASFACPAGTFVHYAMSSQPSKSSGKNTGAAKVVMQGEKTSYERAIDRASDPLEEEPINFVTFGN
jgi:hypothetical protein